MTRIRSLITLLTILATAAIVPVAVAKSDEPYAVLAADRTFDTRSDSEEPYAVLGQDRSFDAVPASGAEPYSVLIQDRSFASPTPAAGSTSSSGFAWEEALIGSGVTFALLLTGTLTFVVIRRRARVEPSI